MIIESLKYIRFEGKPKEWSIEDSHSQPVQFGNFNLIVGKNASGKSRTLGVIREIAELVSLQKSILDVPYPDCTFELAFDDDGILESGIKYKYILKIADGKIVDEKIYVDEHCKLDRINNKIYSETSNDYEPIHIDSLNLAVSEHTNIAYTFLDNFFVWGNSLYKTNFTNQAEKKKLEKSIDFLENNITETFQNPKNILNIVFLAKKLYGKNFDDRVIEDMKNLEYPIDYIKIFESEKGVGICVKEEDFDSDTTQLDMAQGMYRALSFIILLNYAILNEASLCMLIDDLGEGLDFDRSRALIDIISKKTKNTKVQLFLTTNDRYIMNDTAIQYWSVIERKAHKAIFYNYYNSKQNFDDFKFTGLNNFDFLTTQFYKNGFGNADEG